MKELNINRYNLVHHFLEDSAALTPNKVALIHDDQRVTYGEINNQANRMARWLKDTGIKVSERVAIVMENSLEYIVAYYGVLKAGMAVAPLSYDLKPDGLKTILTNLRPKAVLVTSRCERLLKAAKLETFDNLTIGIAGPKLKWQQLDIEDLNSLVMNGEAMNLNLNISPSNLASIIFTSGSQGEPKGVMLSHRSITSNVASICQYLNIRADDIQMVVLPFFYVMGKSLLNTHFAVGATIVINNKFAFPAGVVHQMVSEKVTAFSGVPSTYAYLLYRSPLANYRDKLGSMRYCSQAGGHMAQQLKQELRKVLPEHIQIFIMYGATEAAARLSFLSPELYESKMGSIGKAIDGVRLKIVDEAKQEVPVNQTGELVASGDNIMLGYWNDKAASEKVLNRHGYHTGDFAYQDEDGFIFLAGRRDDLIKVGGHRISLQEIEEILMASGKFIETAVVGIPDKMLGNKLIALVVPKAEIVSENVAMDDCSQLLPRYKLPERLLLLKTLPKNANGKIDRERCVEHYYNLCV